LSGRDTGFGLFRLLRLTLGSLSPRVRFSWRDQRRRRGIIRRGIGVKASALVPGGGERPESSILHNTGRGRRGEKRRGKSMRQGRMGTG